MTDIKTGLWRNNLNGGYIKVKSVGLTLINYSNEGCEGVYHMGVSALRNGYSLYASDQDQVEVVDDTFNDDTPAQTFSALFPINESKCPECGMYLRLDSNRMSIERNGMCCQCFNGIKAGKTIPFDSCDFGTGDKTVTCDFFSLSDDDSGYEIPIGSVWQYMAGSTLEVVTDRGSDWVATRYLRDHFVRNSTQTLKQFRECYRLIYTPGEVCDQ